MDDVPLQLQHDVPEDYAIRRYFWEGHEYKAIVDMLYISHGIELSIRSLKRKLRDCGLRRYGESPLCEIWNAVVTELQGPGRLGGYRSVASTLVRKYHLNVRRETIRTILQQIDPITVEARRRRRLTRRTYTSRGPNHIWHIDGYDKLRAYGFLISGCIDGYSRRLLWLECASSNHDPGVIAHYYMKAVSMLGGFPHSCRTDCGTENVTVAALQVFVRSDPMAHAYGTSPSNQRIEAWWSFYRRSRSQWWMELFESLVASGLFHPGHERETDCLRFCFMNIVREDLNAVMLHWNTHRIRPSRASRCPAGIPDQLYFAPASPAIDCLHRLNVQLPAEIIQFITEPKTCSDGDFGSYLLYLCQYHGWSAPNTVTAASQLYHDLLPFART